MSNLRSRQANYTDARGVTQITEVGIFGAYFAISRFTNSNGTITPIQPPGEHPAMYRV